MTIERLETEIRLPLDHDAIKSGDPNALDSYLTGLVNELRQITLSDVHQRINLLINQGETIVRPPFDYYLLGYWSFDDGTGSTAKDVSINANDATLVNMEEGDWVDGVVGKALAFGGVDEAVTIPYGTAINPTTTPISFTMWIKPTTPATSTVVFSVPSGTNQRMYIGYNGGYWAAGIQASSWGLTSQVAATTDWTFIALVMDGSYANLYVNGVYAVRKAYTTYAFAGDFGISNFGSNLFVGSFDELRIYNKAMTKYEVQSLYRDPSGIQNNNLTADALKLLSDLAADNKITPLEKYTVKPFWDAIVAKATPTTGSLIVQAAAYSVSSTAYATAYSNLYTYLITTLSDVFTPMTDTTDVVRATWDGFWTAYDAAEVALTNAIADAIDTAAFQAADAGDLAELDTVDTAEIEDEAVTEYASDTGAGTDGTAEIASVAFVPSAVYEVEVRCSLDLEQEKDTGQPQPSVTIEFFEDTTSLHSWTVKMTAVDLVPITLPLTFKHRYTPSSSSSKTYSAYQTENFYECISSNVVFEIEEVKK